MKRQKNPLAAARSGKRTKVKSKKNQIDNSVDDKPPIRQDHLTHTSTKAEQIWHKRSGGGLHLFVEYYCRQPDGVVVDMSSSSTDNCINTSDMAATTLTPLPTVSTKQTKICQGMSRASQRRRRKKKQDNVEQSDRKEKSNDFEESIQQTTKATITNVVNNAKDRNGKESLLYNGQLLQLFNEKINKTRTAFDDDTFTNRKQKLEEFFSVLSRPLPITFRIRRNIPSKVEKQLQSELSECSESRISKHVQPTKFDKRIFQAKDGLHKASLANSSPELKDFLTKHSTDGTIARQELGSMLPIWILEKIGAFQNKTLIESSTSSFRILDMCASPGSKTLQAAELIKSYYGGRIRANDINESRLKALQDAVKRSGLSNMEDVIKFSNFDASKYPIPKNESKKYNIVLCDVPCSGDGTSRKDSHIIPNWVPNVANTLHSTQLYILVRALQCVCLNGYVSYSTCSLNPVENEAVIAAAMNQIRNKKPTMRFEIHSIPNSLQDGLIMHPGVTTWEIADFDSRDIQRDDGDTTSIDVNEEDSNIRIHWYKTFQEALDNNMKNACVTLWPETSSFGNNSKSTDLFGCSRLFPQDQNTGGFFVTIMKRSN